MPDFLNANKENVKKNIKSCFPSTAYTNILSHLYVILEGLAPESKGLKTRVKTLFYKSPILVFSSTKKPNQYLKTNV
jgi:hypothetical protein